MARRDYDYDSLTLEQVARFKDELARLERDTKNLRNDVHAAIREHVPDRVARRFMNNGFGIMKRLDYARFLLGGVRNRIDELGPVDHKTDVQAPRRHEGVETDD